MIVATGMDPRLPLSEVAAFARRAEELGFDALHVPETIRDAMVVSALALGATSTLTVRTAVTVAFGRSPMQLALSAWSLAEYAPERFSLGVGSQIQRNIERRYGMPWSAPALHLADYVCAIRACFEAFGTGGRIDHRGPVYRIDHLPAEFRPDASVTAPTIWVGAVNRQMCRVAGAFADGVLSHPSNSAPTHIAEIMAPAMCEGAAVQGRTVPPLIVAPPVYTGVDGAAVDRARRQGLPRLAFVLTTPAYEPTLRRIGHEALGASLRQAHRQDANADLAALIPAEVIDALALSARHDELPALVADRYGNCADGILVRAPIADGNDASMMELVAALRSL